MASTWERDVVGRPVTEACRTALERGRHALIGISPFNSYFSVDRIFELVAWGHAGFEEFHLFVPDLPAAFTLRAEGYSKGVAERKARRQANYLRNKIRRALNRLGDDAPTVENVLLDWTCLATLPTYQARYCAVKDRFLHDEEFRDGCIDGARWVLGRRLSDIDITPRALRLGAEYLLMETPFFLDTVGILGVPASVFCYHNCPDFVRRLLTGGFGGLMAPGQGFTIVVPKGVRDAEARAAGAL